MIWVSGSYRNGFMPSFACGITGHHTQSPVPHGKIHFISFSGYIKMASRFKFRKLISSEMVTQGVCKYSIEFYVLGAL
jgi:hypothetical protein